MYQTGDSNNMKKIHEEIQKQMKGNTDNILSELE